MKAKKCVLIMNTAWGYCFTPERCDSVSQARKKAREMIDEGFAFAYRIKLL